MLNVTDYAPYEIEDAFLLACTRNAIACDDLRRRMSQIVSLWHRAAPESCEMVFKHIEVFLLEGRLDHLRTDRMYPEFLGILTNWQHSSAFNRQLVFAALRDKYPLPQAA